MRESLANGEGIYSIYVFHQEYNLKAKYSLTCLQCSLFVLRGFESALLHDIKGQLRRRCFVGKLPKYLVGMEVAW